VVSHAPDEFVEKCYRHWREKNKISDATATNTANGIDGRGGDGGEQDGGGGGSADQSSKDHHDASSKDGLESKESNTIDSKESNPSTSSSIDNVDITPSIIYGWDQDPQKRKPSPYPCEQILKRLELEKGDCLVVDDLTPGIKMAKTAGIESVGSIWCNSYLEKELVEAGASRCFATVDGLGEWLFGGGD
jgi:hypothetical protein